MEDSDMEAVRRLVSLAVQQCCDPDLLNLIYKLLVADTIQRVNHSNEI